MIPVRWTVPLVKSNSLWKWVHRHASAAANSLTASTASNELKTDDVRRFFPCIHPALQLPSPSGALKTAQSAGNGTISALTR